MSPQFIDYPRYVAQILRGERSQGEQRLAEWRQRDLQPYLDLRQPLRILDVANGRLRPQYTILRAAGHEVYGIDFVNRPLVSWKDVAYQIARRLYTYKLGISESFAQGDHLACGNVNYLPFPNDSFDLVTSVAAFEHFLDVPTVVAELKRILRPGGMAWIVIHTFTSPSGGHNLSFTEVPLQTIPQGVEPWDHLRKRRLPFTVPLNEWRPHQYLDTFEQHFAILDQYCAMREGEHLLTPEIERELAAYSRDELTCGALAVIARKK